MKTDVAIVGGGPAGLMLAIELGCRDVPCVLIEQAATGPTLPKANATSARTMEHYRRRGFAHEVRALGLPPNYPQDVVYCTRLSTHELARFSIPSADEAANQAGFGDYGDDAWPTPELPHRAQQMYIEPILRRHAERYPSVQVRFNTRALAVDQGPDGVEVRLCEEGGAATQTLEARYVVGCDGARSLVREAMGVRYSGRGAERRAFLGGQMVSIYFRSSSLYPLLAKPRAWQYWAINPTQRGLLNCIDGIETFVLLVQLKDGESVESLQVESVLRGVVGCTFEHELIAVTPWNAGYALVADSFRRGRLFVAGDAAHLFTPTGGMGYNTSIDDVVNLGWKLAGVVHGWGPDALLDSYEAERRPIAMRNTAFARAMADSIGHLPVPDTVELDGAAGEQARRALGDALAVHMASEFNIPGLQLGLRYAPSPIVSSEDGPAPPDNPNRYVATAYPGSRAPHLAMGDKALFDHFGRDFTLLSFKPEDLAVWADEAQRMGLPLALLECGDPAARDLYGADLVLVRPDHHIAWRGRRDAVAGAVLRMASGQPEHARAKRGDSCDIAIG